MQLMSIKIGLLSVLLIKTCVRKKGGLGGFAPQTLTRSYYFEPPLSKKRSRATGNTCTGAGPILRAPPGPPYRNSFFRTRGLGGRAPPTPHQGNPDCDHNTDNFDVTKQLRYCLEPTARANYFNFFNCMSTGGEKVVLILGYSSARTET